MTRIAYKYFTAGELTDASLKHCDMMVIDMSDTLQARTVWKYYVPALLDILRIERARLVPLEYYLTSCGDKRERKRERMHFFAVVQDLTEEFDDKAYEQNEQILGGLKEKRVNPIARQEKRKRRGIEARRQTNTVPRRILMFLYPDRAPEIYALTDLIAMQLMRIVQPCTMEQPLPPQIGMHYYVNFVFFSPGEHKFIDILRKPLVEAIVVRAIGWPTLEGTAHFRVRVQLPRQERTNHNPSVSDWLMQRAKKKIDIDGEVNSALESEIIMSRFGLESLGAASSSGAGCSSSTAVTTVQSTQEYIDQLEVVLPTDDYGDLQEAEEEAAAEQASPTQDPGEVSASSTAATSSDDGSSQASGPTSTRVSLAVDERRTIVGAHEFADRLLGQNERLIARVGDVVVATEKLFQLIAPSTFDERWNVSDLFYLHQATLWYVRHGGFSPLRQPLSAQADDIVRFLWNDADLCEIVQRMAKMLYIFLVDKDRRKKAKERSLNMVGHSVYCSQLHRAHVRARLETFDFGRALLEMQTRGTVRQRRYDVMPHPVAPATRGAVARTDFAKFLAKNTLMLLEAELAARPAHWPVFDATIRVPLNDAKLAAEADVVWGREGRKADEERAVLRALDATMRWHRVTPMSVLTSVMNADMSAREGRDFMIAYTPLSYLNSADFRYTRAFGAHTVPTECIYMGDDANDRKNAQPNTLASGAKKRKQPSEKKDDEDGDDDAADPTFQPGPMPRRGRPSKAELETREKQAERKQLLASRPGVELMGEKPKRGRPRKVIPPPTPLVEPAIYVSMTRELWSILQAANYSSVLIARATHDQNTYAVRRNYTEPLASPMIARYLECSQEPKILCHALNALSKLIGMGAEWLPGTERARLYSEKAGRTVSRFVGFCVGASHENAVDNVLSTLGFRDTKQEIGRVQRSAAKAAGLRSRAYELAEPTVDFDDIYAALGVLLAGEGPLPVLMSDAQIPLLRDMCDSGTLDPKVAAYIERQYSACDEQQHAWSVVPDWYKRLIAREHRHAATPREKKREADRMYYLRMQKRVEKRDGRMGVDQFLNTSGAANDREALINSNDDDDEYDDSDPDDLRSVDFATGKFKRPKREKKREEVPAGASEFRDEDDEERALFERARNLPTKPASGAKQYQTHCACGGAGTEECMTLLRNVCDNAYNETPVEAVCCLCDLSALSTTSKHYRGNSTARFMTGVCRFCRARVPSHIFGKEQLAGEAYFQLHTRNEQVSLYDIVNEMLTYAEKSRSPHVRSEVRTALESMRFLVRQWVSVAPCPSSLRNRTTKAQLGLEKQFDRSDPLEKRIALLGNMWFRVPLRETHAILAASAPCDGVRATLQWQRIAAAANFFSALELMSLTPHEDILKRYGRVESSVQPDQPPPDLPALADYLAPFTSVQQVIRYCDHLDKQRQCFPLTTSAFAESTTFGAVSLQSIISCRSMPMHERIKHMMYAGQVPRPLANMVPLMQELVFMNWHSVLDDDGTRVRTSAPPQAQAADGDKLPLDNDDDDDESEEKDLRSRAERSHELSKSKKARL